MFHVVFIQKLLLYRAVAKVFNFLSTLLRLLEKLKTSETADFSLSFTFKSFLKHLILKIVPNFFHCWFFNYNLYLIWFPFSRTHAGKTLQREQIWRVAMPDYYVLPWVVSDGFRNCLNSSLLPMFCFNTHVVPQRLSGQKSRYRRILYTVLQVSRINAELVDWNMLVSKSSVSPATLIHI